ncbi:hypothetical protein JCM33374_g5299 [Metschnikowia sp. JCM 33374]|nr:hypothetical protein JCM33374_g5299 [Metschnikowia sp. JCM 33374]
MIVAARSSGGITETSKTGDVKFNLGTFHKTYDALRNLDWYVQSFRRVHVPHAERPMEIMVFTSSAQANEEDVKHTKVRGGRDLKSG